MKLNKGKSSFKKLNKRGISLIVLVITIILIVILASSIILSISNNNPVKEANLARYESDTETMQSIFTSAVGKVMAQNRANIKIKAGCINSVKSGVNSARGEITYTVIDGQNSLYTKGKIIFDVGENKENEFYTGKKLPIYAAGETKWFVDKEGNISLKIADFAINGDGEEVLRTSFSNRK